MINNLNHFYEDESNTNETNNESNNKPGFFKRTGKSIHDSMKSLGNSLGSSLKNNPHITGYSLTGAGALGLGVGTAALIRYLRKKRNQQ